MELIFWLSGYVVCVVGFIAFLLMITFFYPR